MLLNYAALLQKGAPGAHQAKSKSGCTFTLMKLFEILAAKPLSMFLVAVIVLSVGITALCIGYAFHIAGPVSIRTPHVEVPGLEVQTGSAPGPAGASPNKHGAAGPTAKRRNYQHPYSAGAATN
jgi:hypothetical protein